MKYINYYLLIVACFWTSCKTNYKENNTSIPFNALQEYRLEDSKFDILTPVKYIVLHSGTENMEIAYTDKIETFDNKIYIADKTSSKLVVFDTTGKAIGCVGHKGHGPGEYINITDFSIDKEGNIYILDYNTSSLLRYNKENDFIGSRKLPFNAETFQCISDNKFAFSLTANNSGKYPADHIIITNNDLEKEKTIARYENSTDDNFHLSSFGFTKTKNGIFYHKPIDDHVYLLDDSGNLKNVFLFDFGNKLVPDSYRTNIEDKLEAFTNYTTLTFFTLIYDNYIYGSLFDEGHYKQFVLDRNTHKIYKKTDESIDRYGHWFGTCGSYLVSVFPPIFEKNNYPSDFPNDLKKALAEEKIVLCFYSIKP